MDVRSQEGYIACNVSGWKGSSEWVVRFQVTWVWQCIGGTLETLRDVGVGHTLVSQHWFWGGPKTASRNLMLTLTSVKMKKNIYDLASDAVEFQWRRSRGRCHEANTGGSEALRHHEVAGREQASRTMPWKRITGFGMVIPRRRFGSKDSVAVALKKCMQMFKTLEITKISEWVSIKEVESKRDLDNCLY